MERKLVAPKADAQRAKLKIWGCRGSSAVSGAQVLRYGGDTSCYVVESAAQRCIFDAGTGLARYAREGAHAASPAREGEQMMQPATMFLSHYHMDHLQGFPFFSPIFRPDFSLEVFSVPRDGVRALDALFHAHRPPFFPVALQDLCQMSLVSHDLPLEGTLQRGSLLVRWMDAPHPGGASAFRIEIGGESLVLITDVELSLADERLLSFVADADIAILDAQYGEVEYEARRGWGHSTPVQAAAFAAKAGVRTLYLTHHDPARSDDEVDAFVELARAHHPQVYAAFDGMTLEWGDGAAIHVGAQGSTSARDPLLDDAS